MNCFSGYIDGLGDAVQKGLVKAVGVSNYSGNTMIITCCVVPIHYIESLTR